MHLYLGSDQVDKSNYEELIEFSKQCFIGCMTSFIYGNHVYLKEIYERPKRYHQLFIHNEKPQIIIMSQKTTKKSLIQFPSMSIDKILVSWLKNQIVSQLSTICVWNEQIFEKEDMFTKIEDFKIS